MVEIVEMVEMVEIIEITQMVVMVEIVEMFEMDKDYLHNMVWGMGGSKNSKLEIRHAKSYEYLDSAYLN